MLTDRSSHRVHQFFFVWACSFAVYWPEYEWLYGPLNFLWFFRSLTFEPIKRFLSLFGRTTFSQAVASNYVYHTKPVDRYVRPVQLVGGGGDGRVGKNQSENWIDKWIENRKSLRRIWLSWKNDLEIEKCREVTRFSAFSRNIIWEHPFFGQAILTSLDYSCWLGCKRQRVPAKPSVTWVPTEIAEHLLLPVVQ